MPNGQDWLVISTLGRVEGTKCIRVTLSHSSKKQISRQGVKVVVSYSGCFPVRGDWAFCLRDILLYYF